MHGIRKLLSSGFREVLGMCTHVHDSGVVNCQQKILNVVETTCLVFQPLDMGAVTTMKASDTMSRVKLRSADLDERSALLKFYVPGRYRQLVDEWAKGRQDPQQTGVPASGRILRALTLLDRGYSALLAISYNSNLIFTIQDTWKM